MAENKMPISANVPQQTNDATGRFPGVAEVIFLLLTVVLVAVLAFMPAPAASYNFLNWEPGSYCLTWMLGRLAGIALFLGSVFTCLMGAARNRHTLCVGAFFLFVASALYANHWDGIVRQYGHYIGVAREACWVPHSAECLRNEGDRIAAGMAPASALSEPEREAVDNYVRFMRSPQAVAPTLHYFNPQDYVTWNDKYVATVNSIFSRFPSAYSSPAQHE